MSKEMIVTLLRKDIAELSQLTDGFEQLEVFPPVLLRLAESKAIAVLENIKALAELPAKVEIPVVEEKQVILEPVVTILPEEKQEEPVITIENECLSNQTEITKEKEAEPVVEEPAPCVVEEFKEEVETVTPMDNILSEEDTEPIVNNTIEFEQEDIQSAFVSPYEDDVVAIQEEKEIAESQPEEPLAVVNEKTEPMVELTETIEEEETPEEVKNHTTLSDFSKESVTRNDSITNKKIDDIKQAISLGDRFLFQRELFNNNGELMTKTIAYLNTVTTMEEALQYINKKFNWSSENPTVERFLQILNRRYL